MVKKPNKGFDAVKMKRALSRKLSKKITAGDGFIDINKLKKNREGRKGKNDENN